MPGETGAGGPAPDFFRMAIDLGAQTCVRKPFTPAQLMHAVQTCDVASAYKVA